MPNTRHDLVRVRRRPRGGSAEGGQMAAERTTREVDLSVHGQGPRGARSPSVAVPGRASACPLPKKTAVVVAEQIALGRSGETTVAASAAGHRDDEGGPFGGGGAQGDVAAVRGRHLA